MRVRTAWRRAAILLTVAGGLAVASALPAAAATPRALDCATHDAVLATTYTITHLDGSRVQTLALNNQVRPGDVVTATSRVSAACKAGVQLTGASYSAPNGVLSPDNLHQQLLFNTATVLAKPGSTVAVTVRVPTVALVDTSACPNKHLTSGQTGNGNGSTGPGNPYASTCDGRASQNGNGNGNAAGKPCQGCVGNADNKNPPGQAPGPSDNNAGYECDRNNGVGKGNPAHSGCAEPAHFQIDFLVGRVIQRFYAGGATDYTSKQLLLGGTQIS